MSAALMEATRLYQAVLEARRSQADDLTFEEREELDEEVERAAAFMFKLWMEHRLS